jgi:branched-chain amino acid transport system permease protein
MRSILKLAQFSEEIPWPEYEALSCVFRPVCNITVCNITEVTPLRQNKAVIVSAGSFIGVLIIILLIAKPSALIFGIQRAGLYAAIALPMALVLGIVHIVNLAHGEMMMIAAYLTYSLCVSFGLDPLVAMVPTAVIMFFVGMLLFRFTIRYALKAPELNQLILTFGLAMVLSQGINLLATSQPRKLSVEYVTNSATIGNVSFGTYDFIFLAVAIIFLIGLMLFLKKTRLGKAAMAVGQNPVGAQFVGINVISTYTIIFAIASAMVGIMGAFFLTKMSIFPTVGGAYTMKSFCLVAMAGIGNLPMVLLSSLVLGISESAVQAIPGGTGWSPLVFFGLIIAVILFRSYAKTAGVK